MDVRKLREQPLAQSTPAGYVLDEEVVRLARADERVKWDALMDPHHYLGFKRPEAVTGTDIDKRSRYEELEELPDHWRAQGRKHSIATVLAPG